VAKVESVIPDPAHDGMFLALIEPNTYLDFGKFVPFRDQDGLIERGVLNDAGKISGRAQAAVRVLSADDFNRILSMGMAEDEAVLPRKDTPELQRGFQEPVADFTFDAPRPHLRQLMSRAVRDRNFRGVVLRAYENRCAVTGLRLINGGGRAEAEAAHIKPVEHGGPDIVSNGIALSGTAHWMFDRGLIGLEDDLTIRISRQANDPRSIRSLMNATGKLIVPARDSERPHPSFVRWHQENCFKH
ncbi:MAG: HNH endonuclease, partial [Pseudomonadota bacterium]